MPHSDVLQSLINLVLGYPAGVAATNWTSVNAALDAWVATHVVNDQVALYDSANCVNVQIFKELDSAWQEFNANIQFTCYGNGAQYTVWVTVDVTTAGTYYNLSDFNWAQPNLPVKWLGVSDTSGSPVIRDVSAPAPQQQPAPYYGGSETG